MIAPLLALILGDGKSAVFQVVPAPLLEMSRDILCARFSAVICKRIQTFRFQRAGDHSARSIARLYRKLDLTRREAGVVVSTPDAVKSFQLKAIELLQLVRSHQSRVIARGGNAGERPRGP